MDQSGRTLLRPDHGQTNTVRGPHLGPEARGRPPVLHPDPQRRPKAIPMDQIRRRYPSLNRAILPQNNQNRYNFGIRTLVYKGSQPRGLQDGQKSGLTHVDRIIIRFDFPDLEA